MKTTIVTMIACIALIGCGKTYKPVEPKLLSTDSESVRTNDTVPAPPDLHSNLPPGYTWVKSDEGHLAARDRRGNILFSYATDSQSIVIKKAWESYDLNPDEHHWNDVPDQVNPKPPPPSSPPVVQPLEKLLPKFGITRDASNGFSVVMMPVGGTNWQVIGDRSFTNRDGATQAVVNFMRMLERNYDSAKRDLEWQKSN